LRKHKFYDINTSMESFLMDPEVFPEPERFHPDRFLDEQGCFVAHPNVIPFGTGKRRCLGESLAKTELLIFFAGLLHKFEIRLADKNKIPSTKYRPGITLSPYPFKVRFIARN
jgi:cytochrome P450